MRESAALLAAVALLALAGCSGPGGEAITAEADAPASLDADAVAGEYERAAAFDETAETTVTADVSGDVEAQARRDVTATVRVRRYEPAGAGDDPTAVGVVSAPAVRPIEDQPPARDPVAALATADRVALATNRSVGGLEEADEFEATMLGDETAVTVHEGSVDGEPVRAFAAHGRADGDFVTLVAVLPADADDPEGRIQELLGAVRYGDESGSEE